MKVPSAKKLPSGKWRCQIWIDGRRHSVTADTKREAERAAAGLKAGFLNAKSTDSISLDDAITAYLDAKSNILSPSTVRGYKSIQTHHFQDLMPLDIFKLSHQSVQIAVNEESRRLSAKTVKNAFGLIHTVLKYYGISLDGIRLPQQQRTERHWLQTDEISALLREIDGNKCELPILLALWLGMRRSEILGLCWDCVDLEQSVLVVRRAYVYAGRQDWVLKDTTKTRGSQRVIPLPDYIKERFERLPQGDGDERIFTAYDPNLPRKHLRRACARAGITVTSLHGLRHTFAAVMLREGVDERIVMRQGGWTSNRTMREIYDYIMDDDNKKAAKARDAFFTPSEIAHEIAHEN